MSEMFAFVTSFNQSRGSWKVCHVQTMHICFFVMIYVVITLMLIYCSIIDACTIAGKLRVYTW
ncbi:hypothetical protein EON63_19545 [archaeon]|nr:MAG: hypothetical protein EON63_19545 [archaeon]